MRIPFLLTMIITLFLSACGGSDGNGGDNSPKSKTVFDPWKGIGTEPLSEDGVTDRVRTLSFTDGMTVSYDGSASDGSESVCRRGMGVDENDDSEFFYEVCMSLEDDPYFVMLENNAFVFHSPDMLNTRVTATDRDEKLHNALVWRPLMYNRFATDLLCRRWAAEDAAKTDADCADIFALFGEDFYCQAGVVNGDKALKCSDDWAVTVNGEDDETKTVCRVHIETGEGRCLDAPRDGVADETLVLSMQMTDWEGYRSHQDNAAQFAPGDSAEALIPQDTPSGAELTYWSADENVCTVASSGEAAILPGVTAPEVCKIYLKVEATGFADRTLFAELPILAL